MPKIKRLWSPLTLASLAITVFLLPNLALAGSLTPSAAPAPTMYTLADLYFKLTNNGGANPIHPFQPGGAPGGTFNSLEDIYNAIPTIDGSKIAVGTKYLGIDGVLFQNMFNGTRTTSSASYPGGTQQYGGVDDWNGDGSATTKGSLIPNDSYKTAWTECKAANDYCNTEDDGADYKDDLTGLVWSKTLSSGTYKPDGGDGNFTWNVANNCSGGGNSCSTKQTVPENKTGCEANPNWYVPHQKQMMQAYINGAYKVLESAGKSSAESRTYWSATTSTHNLAQAFNVKFSSGLTSNNTKGSTYKVRCVYSAD